MYTTAVTYEHEMDSVIFGEKPDHLGNVRAVVSDVRKPTTTNGSIDDWTWTADVTQSFAYYPFGSQMPGQSNTSQTVENGGYRHLFQGQERDDEISGYPGTHYNYTFRMHDARIGRFWSIDPLRKKYPGFSPYAFSQNRVIDGIELEGLEYKALKDDDGNYTGFKWDPENAYDDEGNLKEGYYHKAILFKPNDKQKFTLGKWNKSKKRYESQNIGTSTATIYYYTIEKDEEGNEIKTPKSKTFDASTLPSDPDNYSTLASGLYIAKYGWHKLSDPTYRALNIYSTAGKRTGLPAVGGGEIGGVNIHYAGGGNYTGTGWVQKKYTFLDIGHTRRTFKLANQENPVYYGTSQGCPLIDRNKWESFIGLFNTNDVKIGVILRQRSYNNNIDSKFPTAPPDQAKYKFLKWREKFVKHHPGRIMFRITE